MTKMPETRCQCGKEPYRTTAGRKAKPSGMPMNKGKKKVRKNLEGIGGTHYLCLRKRERNGSDREWRDAVTKNNR